MLGLLYTNAFNVSHENGFVNYDFQQLMLLLGFCASKNGNNGLIPKTIAYLNSYKNYRITRVKSQYLGQKNITNENTEKLTRTTSSIS